MGIILELINQLIVQHQQEAMQAWVQFIPAIAGAASSAVGGIRSFFTKKNEDKKLRQMRNKLNNYNAENESWYNTEMSRDYTQTDEAQNMMRQLRDEFSRQTARASNNNIISGATPEAQAVQADSANKAMSNLMGNVGALATGYKQRAADRYMARKNSLQGAEMNFDEQQLNRLGEQRDSAGNLFYNGLTGLAGADWASILGTNKQQTPQ